MILTLSPAFFYSVKPWGTNREVFCPYRFQIPLQVFLYHPGPVPGCPVHKYDEFVKFLLYLLKVCNKGMAVESLILPEQLFTIQGQYTKDDRFTV